jgi:hypothetical protein
MICKINKNKMNNQTLSKKINLVNKINHYKMKIKDWNSKFKNYRKMLINIYKRWSNYKIL